MPRNTPEQTFAHLFNRANDEASSQTERDKAERAMAVWLKRHGKTRRDTGAILLQAEKDDQRANPPPPPPDPRNAAPHPFDDPMFTPADLVGAFCRSTSRWTNMSPLLRQSNTEASDRINAVLAAAGYNFSLLLRWFEELLRALSLILWHALLAAPLHLTRCRKTFFTAD